MSESANVTKTATTIIENDMNEPEEIDESELDEAFADISKDIKNLNIAKDPSLVSKKPVADKEKSVLSQVPPTSSTASLPEEQWSEEYFKKFTTDIESNMESIVNGDPSQLDSLLEQMMNNVSLPEVDDVINDPDEQDLEKKLRDTINKITSGLNNLPMNNLSNIMQGADDTEDSEEGQANTLPFLEDIMQQFLSKDILYPVFSETVAKYPAWLKEKTGKLKPEELDNYKGQFKKMEEVVKEFDKESPGDEEKVKRERFNRILGLLQEMQEYGAPPTDLVGEGALPQIPSNNLMYDKCTIT